MRKDPFVTWAERRTGFESRLPAGRSPRLRGAENQRLRKEDFLCERDPEMPELFFRPGLFFVELRELLLRCDLEVLLLFFERLPLLRDEDLRAGTFAPSFRASESPIAMACLRLFTFFPLPLRSLPCFIACISSWTLLCAFGPYFLLPEDLRDVDFLVAIEPVLPSFEWEAAADVWVARANKRRSVVLRRFQLIGGCRGGQNVLDVDPLRGIVAGVAGHAVAVAFPAVAGIL